MIPFQHLVGKRIFITGGTGFLGRSILVYLASIEQQYSLNFHVDVLNNGGYLSITNTQRNNYGENRVYGEHEGRGI